MNIFLYNKQFGAHGPSVILSHFAEACDRASINCHIIDSLDVHFESNDYLVSYGVKEAGDLIPHSAKKKIAFLTDAISLGYKNKIRFYLKRHNIICYDLFYSIYAYLRYKREEIKVCRYFEKIILVSQVDIDYLIKISKQPKEKFICVPNGVDIPLSIQKKSTSNILRLGLLASWGARQTYAESAWFVRSYYTRYLRSHPDVVLKLFGRGSYINKLHGIPGVEVLGAVESLNEAFADVDIFIGANPKGCGILNRCLDAMSFKVPILSLPACFSGIPESDGLYYQYTNYASFEKQVEYLRLHLNESKAIVDKAYEYIKKYNNWDINYDNLIKELFNK